MEEKDIIKLEDNKDYVLIDVIDGYYFLTNKKDACDFCIRKLADTLNTGLVLLNDSREFDRAIKMFNTKYKK